MEYEFRWSWRSIGALVYFFICLVDLVAMPVYREYAFNKLNPDQIVALVATLPPSSQIVAMQILRADRSWQPITDEMFHVSFGAILGLSALPGNRNGSGFTRRRKKKPTDGSEDADATIGTLEGRE